MPKRSNDFQRLIKTFYDAMASVEGGKVTESAELQEPSGELREVDVLLEAPLYGSTMRIAVECRDRSRRGDIEWIDAIIGKYRNLRIDRVIAVSRRGFSAGAISKATAAGIELRTVASCSEVDWPSEFSRLGVSQFSMRMDVHAVEAEFDGSQPDSDISQASIIERVDGTAVGTVAWMMDDCLRGVVREQIKKFIDTDVLPNAKTMSGLEGRWKLTISVDVGDTFVRVSNGDRRKIKRLIYMVLLRGEVGADEPVEYVAYGGTVRGTVATLQNPEGEYRLRIAQVAGQEKFTVSVEKILPEPE